MIFNNYFSRIVFISSLTLLLLLPLLVCDLMVQGLSKSGSNAITKTTTTFSSEIETTGKFRRIPFLNKLFKLNKLERTLQLEPQQNITEISQSFFSTIFLQYNRYTIYYIDIPAYQAVNLTYFCQSPWGFINLYTKFNSVPTIIDYYNSDSNVNVDGNFIGKAQSYSQTSTIRKEASYWYDENIRLYVLVLNTSPSYSERFYITATLFDDTYHFEKFNRITIIVCCTIIIPIIVLTVVALIIIVIVRRRRLLKRGGVFVQEHYTPISNQQQHQPHHYLVPVMQTSPYFISNNVNNINGNTSYGAMVVNNGSQLQNLQAVHYPMLDDSKVVVDNYNNNNTVQYQQQAYQQSNSAYNLPPQQQSINEDVKKDEVMNQQQQQSIDDDQKMQ
ncbi:hypothetical protein ABK040_004581 [Willaertia magna]